MLLPLSIFVFVILGALAGYLVLHKPDQTVVDRLENLGNWGGDYNAEEAERRAKESQAAELAKKFAQDLNRVAPISATEQKKLQLKLTHAGYRSVNAVIIFRAIQLTSLVVYPLLTIGGLLLAGKNLSDSMLYIGGALLTGFLLPAKVLDYKV